MRSFWCRTCYFVDLDGPRKLAVGSSTGRKPIRTSTFLPQGRFQMVSAIYQMLKLPRCNRRTSCRNRARASTSAALEFPPPQSVLSGAHKLLCIMVLFYATLTAGDSGRNVDLVFENGQNMQGCLRRKVDASLSTQDVVAVDWLFPQSPASTFQAAPCCQAVTKTSKTSKTLLLGSKTAILNNLPSVPAFSSLPRPAKYSVLNMRLHRPPSSPPFFLTSLLFSASPASSSPFHV